MPRNRPESFQCVVATICLVAVLLTGCSPITREAGSPRPQTRPDPAALAKVYTGDQVRFESAVYSKPDESSVGTLQHTLAPLLLMETGAHQTNHPKVVSVDWTGQELRTDPHTASVYWHSDSLILNGRAHARFAYWWYLLAPPDSAEGPLLCRGIRLTLDSQGRPALWEVLSEPGGLQVVFAARSLEDLTQKELGGPLENRRHSLERGSLETNPTVVARILEDGPVPMGPMVYLDSLTRNIVTVICRCMPPQTGRLDASLTYKLVPASTIPPFALPSPVVPTLNSQLSTLNFPQPPWLRPDRVPIEGRLRLPDGF